MSTEEQYGNFCINVYCLLQASKKTSNLPEPEAAKPTFWALTSLSPLLGRSGLLLLGCLYIGGRDLTAAPGKGTRIHISISDH